MGLHLLMLGVGDTKRNEAMSCGRLLFNDLATTLTYIVTVNGLM